MSVFLFLQWHLCFFCYVPLALKCYIVLALCGHTHSVYYAVQSQVDQLWLLCLLFHLSCLSSGLRFRAVSVQRLLQMQPSCPNWKTVPDGCMAQHIPKIELQPGFFSKGIQLNAFKCIYNFLNLVNYSLTLFSWIWLGGPPVNVGGPLHLQTHPQIHACAKVLFIFESFHLCAPSIFLLSLGTVGQALYWKDDLISP